MYVEYRSNNSGGDWWLSDDDWKALERAGWVVRWETLDHEYTDGGREYARDDRGLPKLVPSQDTRFVRDGRFLGALARAAYRHGLPLMDAVSEWERVTGCTATDAGCPCCGAPHSFTEYDDNGEHVRSGPSTAYVASW